MKFRKCPAGENVLCAWFDAVCGTRDRNVSESYAAGNSRNIWGKHLPRQEKRVAVFRHREYDSAVPHLVGLKGPNVPAHPAAHCNASHSRHAGNRGNVRTVGGGMQNHESEFGRRLGIREGAADRSPYGTSWKRSKRGPSLNQNFLTERRHGSAPVQRWHATLAVWPGNRLRNPVQPNAWNEAQNKGT